LVDNSFQGNPLSTPPKRKDQEIRSNTINTQNTKNNTCSRLSQEPMIALQLCYTKIISMCSERFTQTHTHVGVCVSVCVCVSVWENL
jgi:hypothetical protein